MSYSKDEVKQFHFSTLTFGVKNYRGVFIMSESLKARIHALPKDEARLINREAWKQIRVYTPIANRHNNVSIAGNLDIYEDAASHANIAQAVAKETYKVMMGYV